MKKVLALVLVLCLALSLSAAAEVTGDTFTGTGAGRNGDVVVEVTFDGAAIASVKVTEHQETAGIADASLAQIPEAIVNAQSIAVDAVAGATLTSNAIVEAVANAITAAGGDPEAYRVQVESRAPVAGETEHLSCDVVIVGAGGAGMSAAIEARAKGASVIILEKMSFVGGNTAICGGLVPGPGTELQAASGIEDSPEKYVEDIMTATDGTADADLVKVATEEAATLVPWFESLGAEFLKVVPFAGHSVDRLHQEKQLSGAGLAKVLKEAAEANGVEILLNTPAYAIMQDENNVVCGVKAKRSDGTEVEVAAKEVIITAGGFAGSQEMLAEYIPEMAGVGLCGTNANTGDGIRMAQAIGADIAYIDAYCPHASVNPEKVYLVTWEAFMRGGILVNGSGERFVNEPMGYAKCAPVVASQENVYCIVDDYIRSVVEKMAGYDDVTVMAANVQELAEAIGIDAEALAATIDAYNQSVETGSDAFGRTRFEKPLTGNLYAINVETYLLFTMGGIKIDTEARVIDTNGAVIPHLYAAGEGAGTSVTGHGYAGYITGDGLLSALTFGRIAGRNAGDAVLAK